MFVATQKTTTTLVAASAVSSTSTANLSSNAHIAARASTGGVGDVTTSTLKTALITDVLQTPSAAAQNVLNVASAVAAPAASAANVSASANSSNVTATARAANVSATATNSNVSASASSSNITVTANSVNVTASAASSTITGLTVVPNIASNGSVTSGTHINYAANRTAVGAPTYTVKSVGTTVSNNSLFRTPTSSTANYLVETDPQFTNYRQWLSSDYMITALALDPQQVQKRLGDGFYEQRLIREQVATLTGTRFLDGYADDETQYADLMSNAVTYAKAWNLRPGIALSDEQMAALTSDIVWLVEKEVTLPSGTTTRALVPQLYTKLRSGDLNESGALLGGANVVMNLTGDANNLGTIAGRNIVSLSANNINNMNSVSGNVVSLDASRDINVIGGQVQASSALFANAGRNINVASTATASDQSKAFTYKGVDRVAGLYVGATNGTLALNAGGNINLTAANIINSGLNSSTGLSAKGDINLATITQGSSNSVVVEAGKQFLKDGQTSEIGTSIIGGGNVSMNAVNVNLRAANIQAGIAQAPSVAASNATNGGTGALTIAALNNINVTAGVATQNYAFAMKTGSDGGILGSKSETVTVTTSNNTFAQGSNLGGNTVTLQAGFLGSDPNNTAGSANKGNINVVGSNILSTNGTNLIATGNVSITTAVNTFNSTFSQQTTESGFLSGGGGIGFTYGDRTQRQTQNQSGTTAAASTIGSTNGSINILAGGNALITGSNLITGTLNATSGKLEGRGDIHIQGANVSITEARETTTGQSTTFFEQSGISVSVNAPILGMAQNAASIAQAARNTSNSRVSALGVAAIGLQGYNTANQVASSGGNPANLFMPTVTVGIGSSTSSSQSNTASNTAAGSNIQSAGNVNIQATGNSSQGAGNLLIQGSNVQANNNVSLDATRDIQLLASQNTQSQSGTSSSSSSGVSATFGMTGLTGVGVNRASSSGNSNGQSTSYTNSAVNAGNVLSMRSGGNTTLAGAVVSGNTTNVNVGGSLIIQSLQDTSTYSQTGQSSGFSVGVSVGSTGTTSATGPVQPTTTYSPGGSITVGKTNINNNFQSVNQTSGIQAGAGGFNVQVGGNTTLIGGQITSNQSAITSGLNTFSTNGTLTVSNLNNNLNTQGQGYSVTVGLGSQSGSSGAGIGVVNSQASSTTVSAISAGNITVGGVQTTTSSNGQSLNTNTTTGQNNSGITNTFNAATTSTDIAAQIQITRSFGSQASKLVGDTAEAQTKERDRLRALAANETDPDKRQALLNQATEIDGAWGEFGTLRLAAHTLIGALTGGASGAAGALAGTITAPLVADALRSANITGALASGLTGLASTLVGGAVGGTAGAITSFNEVTNNYLGHQDAAKLEALRKQAKACTSDRQCESITTQIRDLEEKDRATNAAIKAACDLNPSSQACTDQRDLAQQARLSYVGQTDVTGAMRVHANNATATTIYDMRAGAPVLTGIGNAAGNTLAGPVVLAVVATKAAAGDEASQAQLRAAAGSIAETIKDPIGAVSRKLDEANAADAAGNPALAAQIRAQLFIDVAGGAYGATALTRSVAQGVVNGTAGLVVDAGGNVVAATNRGATSVLGPAQRSTFITTLGPFPSYVQLADDLGARYFQIPTSVWNGMSATERWAANVKFLERTIENGSTINLSHPVSLANPAGSFVREIEFMQSRGYTVSPNGLSLQPPKKP